MAFKDFNKNVRQSIRVTPTRYMGHELIDIRIFAPSKDDPKTMIATKKGISINVDLVPDLVAALKWAVGQPNVEDSEAAEAVPLTREASTALAAETSKILKSHGAPVHWDMADRLVRGGTKTQFESRHLRSILVTREDLFEHVGSGCFRAR